MNKKLAVSGVIFLIFAVVGCSSGPNMKEGKWEITTEMSMKGVPMKMPAMSHTQCLTKNEMIPQDAKQSDNNCVLSEQDTSGDKVSWKVVCKDGSTESVSEGSITYAGETFNGTINVSMSGGPMTMSATNDITGKYLGPCK